MTLANFTHTNDCFFHGLVHLRELEALQKPTIILCVVNVILAVAAATGNSFIIAAIYKKSNLHTPTNTLICALAFSDLGVGLLVHTSFVPYKIAEIKKENRLFCLSQTIHFATVVLFSIFSLLIITSIAIERYLALRLSVIFNSTVTVSRVVKVVAGCFLLSLAVLIIGVAKYSTVLDMTTSAIMIICLTVNTSVYLTIFREVRRLKRRLEPSRQQSAEQVDGSNTDNNKASITLTKYNRSVNTTLAISSLLLICYVPIVANIIVANFVKIERVSALQVVFGATSTLMYLNSTLNPLLYMFRIRPLRSAVVNVFQSLYHKLTG